MYRKVYIGILGAAIVRFVTSVNTVFQQQIHYVSQVQLEISQPHSAYFEIMRQKD